MVIAAGIDCGTNSLRLLITSSDGTELGRYEKIIRLGQNVDSTHMFAQEALDRLAAALADYVQIMREKNVDKITMVATSACRDVVNRDDFFTITHTALSTIDPTVKIKIITGVEEAKLSFQGVIGAIPPLPVPTCHTDKQHLNEHHLIDNEEKLILITDLGGGSTEFTLGSSVRSSVRSAVRSAPKIVSSCSINIGCVRITERFFTPTLHDVMSPTQRAAAEEYIDAQLMSAIEQLGLANLQRVHSWYGVAGTFTTLAAMALGLSEYDNTRIHCATCSCDDFDNVCLQIIDSTREQREHNSIISPGRVDVLPAGAIIIHRIFAVLLPYMNIRQISISEHDLLDGIVDSIFAETS